jgi:hypothetical protein
MYEYRVRWIGGTGLVAKIFWESRSGGEILVCPADT